MPALSLPPITKRRLSRRAALGRIARAASLATVAAVLPLPLTALAQPPDPVPPDQIPEPPPQNPAADPASDPSIDPASDPSIDPGADVLAEALDKDDGYAGWTKHIGTPDEAVCHVRVTVFDGSLSGVTREGSGVVVRCDGFVLLPEALFGPDRSLQKTARVSLTFRASDGPSGPSPKEPLSPYGPPRYHSAKTDYVLVKVNGHHFKGLHLLDARNFRSDMAVKVVWAQMPDKQADAKVTVPVAKSCAAVTGGRVAGSVPHYILTFADGEGELPPLGAVVLEPESLGVLGIVTQASDKSVWMSPFGYFQYVSNDIGLKVSPSDITGPAARTNDAASSSGQVKGMVKVPGGPTRLSGALATDYRFYYGTDVVCMPDFFIDAFPVTIGAYRKWLKMGARQPLGWVENIEQQTHERNPDIPVSGLIADDGLRYAAGHNKRVPIPVEWARAGLGAKTQWAADLWGEWFRVTGTQKGIADQKVRAYNAVIEEQAKRNKSAANYRPPTGIAAPNVLLDEISRQQTRLYKSYWDKKPRWLPYQHSPVGFYADDVSKWGVQEVVSNAAEMCQPNYAARPYEPAPKPYATTTEPFYSRTVPFGWLGYCVPGDMDMEYALFAYDPANPTTMRSYVFYRDGLYTRGSLSVTKLSGFGFRCAL